MRLCLVLTAAAGLAACSATGSGTGIVTSAKGNAAGGAVVSYLTEGGATAQLSVSMPDGEVFRGSALSGSTAGTPGFAFAPGRHGTLLITSPRPEWTGDVIAALHSGRGHTMDCRLREKRVGLGLEGGALGSCTVSDGRHVQIDL